jgi:hypothetical protein
MAYSRKRGGPRLREIGKGTLLVLCSTTLFLLLMEIALRAFGLKEEMQFSMDTDEILHHRYSPNTMSRIKTPEFDTDYSINSLGLRDKEYTIQKPLNTFRILMVGDSFTEGCGVYSYEAFPKQLEARLQTQHDSLGFEVINCGVKSYSPLLEYLYLKNYGLQLSPDLVILNFDLSDVYDDVGYTALARFDENGIPVGVSTEEFQHDVVSGPIATVKNWFKDNIWLYQSIRIRIAKISEARRRERDFLKGDFHRDKYAMLHETYVDNDSNWALTHKYILLIRDMLEKKGIDFWMTVYPYGVQIHPKEWSSGREYWQLKQDTVYSTWPQDSLAKWATYNGIRCINLCPNFKELSKKVFPLYYNLDGHWRAAGHQLVADVLYRNLRSYLNEKK